MNRLNATCILICFLCLAAGLFAQTQEDIQGFLAAGQLAYNDGELMGAALEFENVLMLDSGNFSAKVWLAQVYADLKDFEKSRAFLRQAAMQAPDHPRVAALQKMLGDKKNNQKNVKHDPVTNEAMTLLGKNTNLRRYGLVIPEEKVSSENQERNLLVFDDLIVQEKKQEEKPLDVTLLEDEPGPITPAIKAWEHDGLSAGLDKYFELLIADPSLAAQDDNGLVTRGREYYIPRLKANPQDLESRYYAGMLSFINGMYQEADLLLSDYRKNPEEHANILNKVFKSIDNWKEKEKERLLALRLAEEQRLAEELAEKERQERLKQNKDVWANLQKNKQLDQQNDGKPADAEAVKLHEDGYELYKKGKLEEAIEKFEAAIAKDAGNGKFHYHLGLAWTDKGLAGESDAFNRAVAEFERVISLAPDDKIAQDSRAMIRDIESAKQSLGN
jgi:tetratricopeptide (TPR) repeat protein